MVIHILNRDCSDSRRMATRTVAKATIEEQSNASSRFTNGRGERINGSILYEERKLAGVGCISHKRPILELLRNAAIGRVEIPRKR